MSSLSEHDNEEEEEEEEEEDFDVDRSSDDDDDDDEGRPTKRKRDDWWYHAALAEKMESWGSKDVLEWGVDEFLAKKREKRARKQLEKRAAKEQMLRNGIYYATVDDVWEPCSISFTPEDYQIMVRDGFPIYKALDNKLPIVPSPFRVTLQDASDSGCIVATKEADVTPSHLSLRNDEIWPVDVLQSKFHQQNNAALFLLPPGTSIAEAKEADSDPEAEKDDASSHKPDFANPDTDLSAGSEMAHLVPSTSEQASLYYHVALWVFGVPRTTLQHYDSHFPQKLLHGSSPRSAPEEGEAAQKEYGIGLKHMICNKIRLAGHSHHLDANPRVLIVPLLSLQQAKEWQGEGYHAIFMISTGHPNPNTSAAALPLRKVAAGVLLLDFGEEASKPEITVAEELLTATIKGLAFALTDTSPEAMKWESALDEQSKAKLDELRTKFVAGDGNNKMSILVPKVRQDKLKPVRKITFAPAFGPVGKSGHPAPDPLLLAIKAGLNWSAFHGQRLMPAGKYDDVDNDNDSDRSERSIAAMKEYLAMRQHADHTSQEEAIMKMTISTT